MDRLRLFLVWVSFLGALGLGYPIWRSLTRVERYPLPYDTIGNWAAIASEPPGALIGLDIVVVDDGSVQPQLLRRWLRRLPEQLNAKSGRSDDFPPAFRLSASVAYFSASDIFSTDQWDLMMSDDYPAVDELLNEAAKPVSGHYVIYLLVSREEGDEHPLKSAVWGIHRHAWLRLSSWDKSAQDEYIVPTIVELLDTHVVSSMKYRWTPLTDESELNDTLTNVDGGIPDQRGDDGDSITVASTASPISSSYHMSFSLLVEDPGDGVYSWDFEHMYQSYLSNFICDFDRTTARITINSQVVNYAKFVQSPKKTSDDDPTWYYTIDSLPHFVHPYDWANDYAGGTGTTHLNFMVVVPSLKHSPLRIMTSDGLRNFVADEEFLNETAYVLEREAGIIVYNRVGGDDGSDHAFTEEEHHHFASIFITQMRKLLGVTPASFAPVAPPEQEGGIPLFESEKDLEDYVLRLLGESSQGDSPSSHERVDITTLPDARRGVTQWELDSFQRHKTFEQFRGAVYTLNALVKLLKNQTMMPVTQAVGPKVDAALESLAQCHSALEQSDWVLAHNYAARANEAAQSAFYHSTMVSWLHYPPQHEFAIYVPHFVPVGVPIVKGVLMEILIGLAALGGLVKPYVMGLFQTTST